MILPDIQLMILSDIHLIILPYIRRMILPDIRLINLPDIRLMILLDIRLLSLPDICLMILPIVRCNPILVLEVPEEQLRLPRGTWWTGCPTPSPTSGTHRSTLSRSVFSPESQFLGAAPPWITLSVSKPVRLAQILLFATSLYLTLCSFTVYIELYAAGHSLHFQTSSRPFPLLSLLIPLSFSFFFPFLLFPLPRFPLPSFSLPPFSFFLLPHLPNPHLYLMYWNLWWNNFPVSFLHTLVTQVYGSYGRFVVNCLFVQCTSTFHILPWIRNVKEMAKLKYILNECCIFQVCIILFQYRKLLEAFTHQRTLKALTIQM